MREVWRPEALVRAVESVHLAVRDRDEDVYDGVTERGAGPFSVVVPGHPADRMEAYWDEMDPLPWADDHPVDHAEVYLDTYDGDLAGLFETIDAYTDGAVMVEGDGRVYPYTVELSPDVSVEEAYEPGYGTKTRTALNISAVDVEPDTIDELAYVKEYFPDRYRELTTAADRVWDTDADGYGDVVAVATSSSTGETRVFDDGALRRHHTGVVEKRDTEALWENVLDTVED